MYSHHLKFETRSSLMRFGGFSSTPGNSMHSHHLQNLMHDHHSSDSEVTQHPPPQFNAFSSLTHVYEIASVYSHYSHHHSCTSTYHHHHLQSRCMIITPAIQRCCRALSQPNLFPFCLSSTFHTSSLPNSVSRVVRASTYTSRTYIILVTPINMQASRDEGHHSIIRQNLSCR